MSASYGATSASSRKIKVTMREHEGGDKLQRNCCFLFALVVGALAAAFVAHGQRETSLSLEWTETDVVAVKAGNRIHYDDDTRRLVGKDFDAVKEKCIAGRLHPQLLFYERSAEGVQTS